VENEPEPYECKPSRRRHRGGSHVEAAKRKKHFFRRRVATKDEGTPASIRPPTRPPRLPVSDEAHHFEPAPRCHTVKIDNEELAMLKAWRQAKTCARKVDYPTETAAMRSAVTLMNRVGRGGKKMSCYQCPTCNNWHLTSAKKARKQNGEEGTAG
jgi:hypothetical protein